MLISLLPTQFDHFHFHPTLGLDPALILTLRPNQFTQSNQSNQSIKTAVYTSASPYSFAVFLYVTSSNIMIFLLRVLNDLHKIAKVTFP